MRRGFCVDRKSDFVSIYLPYHFNKEVVQAGLVDVRFVRSAFNLADLLTKPVSKGVLDKLLMIFCGYSVFSDSKLKSMTDYK